MNRRLENTLDAGALTIVLIGGLAQLAWRGARALARATRT